MKTHWNNLQYDDIVFDDVDEIDLVAICNDAETVGIDCDYFSSDRQFVLSVVKWSTWAPIVVIRRDALDGARQTLRKVIEAVERGDFDEQAKLNLCMNCGWIMPTEKEEGWCPACIEMFSEKA